MIFKGIIIGIGILVIAGALFISMKSAVAPDGAKVDTVKESTVTSAPLPSPSQVSQGTGRGNMPNPVFSSQPSPASVKNQGRAIFVLKDEAVDLSTLKSIIIIISRVEVQNSSTQGWIPVVSSVKAYDLLRLFNASEQVVLADINMDIGMYSQIRIAIDKILVTTKDGNTSEAVLPSQEIKITMRLVVERGGKSGATIDIMSDKALHIASNGRFIFMPVVHLDTKSSIGTVQIFGEKADLIGGKTDSDSIFGSDETGTLKRDFSFNRYAKFEIKNGKIKLLSN